MAKMLEKEIEKKLVKKIESIGGLCFKFTSPDTVGVPDRIAVLPDGKIIFIEVKSQFGRLANIQKYRIDQLRKRNCDARVIKGQKALEEFFKELRGYAI